MSINSWLPFNHSLSPDKPRVFCFPHSGAGASVFYRWIALSSQLEICPIQLPGRESRYGEPLLTSMPELIDSLVKVLSPLINDQTAFFGHSLGGYIAFECAKHFNNPQITTFISASNPPDRRREKSIRYLSDLDFLQEISRYGGLPVKILEDNMLWELLLPPLRADITLFETYLPQPPVKIPGKLVAFGGAEDPLVTEENLMHWKSFASEAFSFHLFPGDHFYYQRIPEQVIEKMIRDS